MLKFKQQQIQARWIEKFTLNVNALVLAQINFCLVPNTDLWVSDQLVQIY